VYPCLHAAAVWGRIWLTSARLASGNPTVPEKESEVITYVSKK
jgi:hypothetical protein